MAHKKLSEEEARIVEEHINQTMYQLIMQKHPLKPEQFNIDERDQNIWEIILERANKVKIEYVSMRRNPKIKFRDDRMKAAFHRFCCLVGGFYTKEWNVVERPVEPQNAPDGKNDLEGSKDA